MVPARCNFKHLRIACQRGYMCHVHQLSTRNPAYYLAGMFINRHKKRECFFTGKVKSFMIKIFNNPDPIGSWRL